MWLFVVLLIVHGSLVRLSLSFAVDLSKLSVLELLGDEVACTHVLRIWSVPGGYCRFSQQLLMPGLQFL